MLEIRRLRLLRELDARGTIAATAEALSFSAPAVSQQLSKLEAEAGVELLERVGRGVRLTDAGRRLVEHTGALLARLEEAEADLMSSSGEVRGTLHVTAFQTATVTMLAPALAELRSRHPGLVVHISEVEPDVATRALLLGEVDLVIADEYELRPRPHHRSIEREELLRDPLDLVLPASHPLATDDRPIALQELADEPWAVGLAGSAYAETVVAACNQLGGFHPLVHHHATDLVMLLALVRAGQAVALLPRLLGAQHDPAVAVRPVADRPLERFIFTAARPRPRPGSSAAEAAASRHSYGSAEARVPAAWRAAR
jgi:DNA-binding transcriptional LysR family regulator